MVLNYNVDVGSCLTNEPSLRKLDCTNNDGRHYCCVNITSILPDAASRYCCNYKDYAAQHWVSLSVMRIFLILLIPVFLSTFLVLVFFLITSYNISEKDIQRSRRIILNTLMKKQLLYKSGKIEPSAVTGMTRLSNTLSASISAKRRNRKQGDKRSTSADQASAKMAYSGAAKQ